MALNATLLGPLGTVVGIVNPVNVTHAYESSNYKVFDLDIGMVVAPLLIALWIICVVIAKMVFHFSGIRGVTRFFPDSSLLLLVGLVIGCIVHYADFGQDHYVLTPDLFYHYLLPPIVLEAGYFMPNRLLFHNIGAVCSFAILGTLFNIFAIGLSLWGLQYIFPFIDDSYLPLIQLLLFASLICAVDPVAVLAIFDEGNVNDKLNISVFGESLFSDAVTMIFYHMISSLIGIGNSKGFVSSVDYLLGVVSLFVMAIGGAIIGFIFAFVCSFLTKFTDHVRLLEPLLVLAFAYGSYLVAEMFHMSSILAIVVFGQFVRQYVSLNLCKESKNTLNSLVKLLAHCSETIIFVFIGTSAWSQHHVWNIPFIIGSLIFCLVFRALGVYLLCFILNKTRSPDEQYTFAEQFIMAYGGLRGVIAYGLAASISVFSGGQMDTKDMFVTTTVTIVIFTVFFQGSTIKPLVDKVIMRKKNKSDEENDKEENIFEIEFDEVQDYIKMGMNSIVGTINHGYFLHKLDEFNSTYLHPMLVKEDMRENTDHHKKKQGLVDVANLSSALVRGNALNGVQPVTSLRSKKSIVDMVKNVHDDRNHKKRQKWHRNYSMYAHNAWEDEDDVNKIGVSKERLQMLHADSIKEKLSDEHHNASVNNRSRTTSFANGALESIKRTMSETEDQQHLTLMYANHEKIPLKDFGSEIRGTMDMDHLLNKAVIMLDIHETGLEEIFDKIIHQMDIQEPEFTFDQVRNAMFTQDADNQFNILSHIVQSVCTTGTMGGAFDYDQTWICALCMLPTVQHRHMAIARLTHPTNLGRTMQDVNFIIIVIAPSRAKTTKTALETARSFATLFADIDIRQQLMTAKTNDSFRKTLLDSAHKLAVEQNEYKENKFSLNFSEAKNTLMGPNKWYIGRGVIEDVKRRMKYYASDYYDGVIGPRTLQKLFSTTVFLYFACLLPSIAFGALNDENTGGIMSVKKTISAQAIGGLFFAVFSGQPMVILLTTAPLAIYIKIIFEVSHGFGVPFLSMYACVGLWCQFFLIIFALTECSNVMKWSTRSSEEVFSLFITVAFVVGAFKAMNQNFQKYYHSDQCEKGSEFMCSNLNLISNGTSNATDILCQRENSLLYILLMFGTVWLGLWLYNFRKTPFLTRSRREMMADYSLPVAVLIMSFTGAYCFRNIASERFNYETGPLGYISNIFSLPVSAIFLAMGLGFCLSLLFFIDQNFSAAMVNTPQNKLRKGSGNHWDLVVVGALNAVLSIYGLPWMHGALPHSPLHVRALADVEERVVHGHVHEIITNVRETRLATILAHVLIGISAIFLLPTPLNFIPKPVLYGLFLYMAATSLDGNQMFERVLLLVTEQAAYPPTHYIRRVPQRKVHLFTVCQLVMLGILCLCGFYPEPYVEMIFPIICVSFLPIRHLIIPRLIEYKYLDALDGH